MRLTPNLRVVIREGLEERGATSLRKQADLTGITKDSLDRRLKGENNWTLPDLEKIAAAFDVTVDQLVAEARKRDAS
jgi:transcriptional regulator with XRE-family HTH domain